MMKVLTGRGGEPVSLDIGGLASIYTWLGHSNPAVTVAL